MYSVFMPKISTSNSPSAVHFVTNIFIFHLNSYAISILTVSEQVRKSIHGAERKQNVNS